MVKNAVQQHPAGRDDQDTEKKIGVVQYFRRERSAFKCLSVDKKQCPGQHRHKEIGDAIKECIALALVAKQGLCCLVN